MRFLFRFLNTIYRHLVGKSAGLLHERDPEKTVCKTNRHHGSPPCQYAFAYTAGMTVVLLLLVLLPAAAYAQCASPAGIAGEITYNTSESMAQYCDGTNWIAMGRKAVVELNGDSMPTAGLVGYWKLDETSGTTATDSSGNGYDGTMLSGLDAGTNSVAGRIGTALDFGGRIDIGDNLDLIGSPLTLSAWVNPDTIMLADAIIDKLSGGGNYRLVLTPTNRACFGIRSSGGTYEETCTANNTVSTGVWTHILATFDDATTGQIYINGVLASSKTDFSVSRGDSTNPLYLGYSLNNSQWFDGRIDDARIYNRVLSESEIKCLAGTGPCLDAGLVGHWKLDETSGASLVDSSGYSHTGTWVDGVDNDVSGETGTGKITNAITFDGSDDVATVTRTAVVDDLGTASGLSACLWMYPHTKPVSGGYTMFGKNSGSAGWRGWNMYLISDSSGEVGFSNNYGRWKETGNVTSMLNSWHHVCATWNGGSATSDIIIYIDGANAGATGGSGGSVSLYSDATYDIKMGDNVTSNEPYDGALDDIHLYNRVLSSSEVVQLYCQGGPGKIDYDTSLHVMTFCSENALHVMGPPGDGGGGCSNPAGVEGEMTYNTTFNTMQYCEGDTWIAIGK